jgi:hypothetical protein
MSTIATERSRVLNEVADGLLAQRAADEAEAASAVKAASNAALEVETKATAYVQADTEYARLQAELLAAAPAFADLVTRTGAARIKREQELRIATNIGAADLPVKTTELSLCKHGTDGFDVAHMLMAIGKARV